MIVLAIAEGMLDTIDVYGRPLDHTHQLRIAAVVSALIALSCLYVAVFTEPRSEFFNERRVLIAAIGFGFAAIGLVLVVLVLLSA